LPLVSAAIGGDQPPIGTTPVIHDVLPADASGAPRRSATAVVSAIRGKRESSHLCTLAA
jgi:hypothetical protein